MIPCIIYKVKKKKLRLKGKFLNFRGDLRRYLTGSILNGSHPVTEVYGMSTFEYQGGDPRFNKVFNSAMKGHSTLVMNNILRRYNGFADVQVLVDVGGNTGSNLGLITSFYPHIRGINFDLPHVVADALALARVEHRGGDMFEAVPAGDAIMLKWVLHDWSDEHCVKILKNCWKALPAEKGKVVVVEYILPAAPEATPEAMAIFQLDLCMAAYNVGGKERTAEELKALAKEAGSIVSTLFLCSPALGSWSSSSRSSCSCRLLSNKNSMDDHECLRNGDLMLKLSCILPRK